MLQLGNRKLSREVGIFSLPRLTCPELCSYCYARTYATWPAVALHHASNWLQSLLPSFVPNMCNEIRSRGIRKVRIHEVGDFYSRRYYEKWADIARIMPHVQFLAYTKEWKYILLQRPSNMLVYRSLNPGDWSLADEKILHAVIVQSANEAPAGYKLCEPPRAHSTPYCGSECNHCWTAAGPVAFIKH